MPGVGVYLCDVVAKQLYPGRYVPSVVLPAVFAEPGNRQQVLLQRYNPTANPANGVGQAVIIATLVGATGPGLIEVFSGATVDAMRIAGRGGGLNNPRRNAINTWVVAFNAIAAVTLTSNIVASNVGTANTSAPHLLVVGDMVTIYGGGLTDGPHTVLSITDADTFTYAATGIPNATYANGQATREVVIQPVPPTISSPGAALEFLVRQERPDFDIDTLEF